MIASGIAARLRPRRSSKRGRLWHNRLINSCDHFPARGRWANVVNAADPEVVVIGGGLAARLGEEMVGRIREVAYDRFLLQRDRERVRIVATELKDRAAPLGAAWVARSPTSAGCGR